MASSHSSSSSSSSSLTLTSFTFCLCLFLGMASAQLSPTFYSTSCPNVLSIIKTAVNSAVSSEARMGASLLRLHFHDCFVNGCDASVLLVDTANFTGEQSAPTNNGSLRGFNVIDTIKTQLESSCPGVVSCADIVAVAARDSVVALGGNSWTVPLGRRDSTTASLSAANSNIPGPGLSLSGLISSFSNKGFTAKEMVVLSGSHTIGQARCQNFRNRIYNEANINASFATSLKAICPTSGGNNNLAPLDTTSPTSFDNAYYADLISQKGLLHSDQQLFNGSSTDAQVRAYSSNQATFLSDFANAMVKMGNLSPLTGTNGSHTIGQARCQNFRNWIYNEANINASFATSMKANCPTSGGNNNLAPLDTTSPTSFDNAYYADLISQKGLLHSDQHLFNGGSTDAQVKAYSSNQATFLSDFANAMVKMGNLSPLTGTNNRSDKFTF